MICHSDINYAKEGVLLKVKRKRKIAKLIKSHALPLMDIYFNNEHALAVIGTSIIPDEKAWEIADTISHYAHILYRDFDDSSDIYKNDWAKLILDFY